MTDDEYHLKGDILENDASPDAANQLLQTGARLNLVVIGVVRLEQQVG